MFGLTKEDMQRLDKNNIKSLIKTLEGQLSVWSLPNEDRKQIENEVKFLKSLL